MSENEKPPIWELTELLREMRERNNKNVEKIGVIEELLHLFNLTWTHGKTVNEWMEDFNKVDTVSFATKKFLEAVRKHPAEVDDIL